MTLTRLDAARARRSSCCRRGRHAAARRWIDRLGIRSAGRARRCASCRAGISRRSRSPGCCTTTSTCCARRADARHRRRQQGADLRLIDELVSRRRSRQARKAVLLVSSYLPELLGVCDRIAVMSRGRLGPARPVEEWTEHSLLMDASGRARRVMTARAAPRRARRARSGSSLVALVFGALIGPQFFGAANLELMARQTAIVCVAALGMTMVIVAGRHRSVRRLDRRAEHGRHRAAAAARMRVRRAARGARRGRGRRAVRRAERRARSRSCASCRSS